METTIYTVLPRWPPSTLHYPEPGGLHRYTDANVNVDYLPTSP
jgi:hypothetical protein